MDGLCTKKAQMSGFVSRSEHVERIDIDTEGESGGDFAAEEVDLPKEAAQGRPLLALEEELKAVLAAQAGEGAGGGTKNLDAPRCFPQNAGEFLRSGGGEGMVIAGENQIDQVAEGGVAEFLTESDLLPVEGGEVMV